VDEAARAYHDGLEERRTAVEQLRTAKAALDAALESVR
jgi:hypothetical protein